MANNAYICRIRTDLGSGAFQVLDLYPNASQRNLIYEPNPQTGYLPPLAENDTLAALVANATVAEYKGLAAYLIDHVIDNALNVTITVAVANATANAIIALKAAGSPVTLAAINNALVANGVSNAGAGTTLATAPCTGTVKDVLKILGGGKYVLPKGKVVGNLAAPLEGGAFNDSTYQEFFATGALQISCGEGTLAAFSKATFSYNQTTGAALVVYDESGNVLT